MLPVIKSYEGMSHSNDCLLIIAEGFESRSLNWIKQVDEGSFKDIILCKYRPEKQSKLAEMKIAAKARTGNNLIELDYDRFAPTIFEQKLRDIILATDSYSDIYVDISVMSKLLIMIILNELKKYEGNLHIIYSEPEHWSPTKEQFEKALKKHGKGDVICLSSIGVGDIVRTPGLSSIIMQNSPAVLVAGLSFNEQLVNILVNETNPEKVILINQVLDREGWRQAAIEKIHNNVLNNYNKNSKVYGFSLNEYDKVFKLLAEVYNKYWLTNRIIISPTGYKFHAIAYGILKICCPDVHVEYPTPDSYLFDGYSSDEIINTYELCFESFHNALIKISEEYILNG